MGYTIDVSTPVLVTGGTSFIAGVLIEQLLKAGVAVHTTVRDVTETEKFQYLKDLALQHKATIKFFSADLLIDGSFTDAMQGCSIVFHVASPFIMNVADPMKDLIEPAVNGTANVLNTATATPSVKRVVLTSSVYAVSGGISDGYDKSIMGTATMLTEDNWNRTSTLTENPYGLSKVLAEQKAWVIAGSQTQWKLVTVNPGFVVGPGVIYHESSTSFGIMVNQYGNGNQFIKIGSPKFGIGCVDVRDVAATHIAAAYTDTASGRYLCVGHNTDFAGVTKALRTKYKSDDYPVPVKVLRIPKWLLYLIAPYLPGRALTRAYVLMNYLVVPNFDATKSIRELGITYRTLEESCCDMYQQLIDNKVVVKLSKGITDISGKSEATVKKFD